MLFHFSTDTFYKQYIITNDDKSQTTIFYTKDSYWGIKIKPDKPKDVVYDLSDDPLQIACEDIADLLDELSPSGRNNGRLFDVLGEHYRREHDSMLACLDHLKEIFTLFKKNKIPAISKEKTVSFDTDTILISKLSFEEKSIDSPKIKINPKEFYDAIKASDEESVVKFLKQGVDCNQRQSISNIPPLSMAIETRDIGIIKLLLQHGAKVNIFDHDGILRSHFPKHHYALTDLLHNRQGREIDDKDLEIIALLLKEKADLYWEDEEGNTPLNLVLKIKGKNKNKLIEMLIEAGLNVNKENSFGKKEGTPITVAIKEGNKDGVECLLEYKASLNLAYLGKSPLQVAVYGGYQAILSLLLEKKADINYYDRTFENWASKKMPTSLQIAVDKNNIKMVTMLLEAKADVNCFDKFHTPLMTAVYKQSSKLVHSLLNHHANPFMEQNSSCYETPVHASEKKMTNIIKKSAIFNQNTERLLSIGFFNHSNNKNIIAVKDKPIVKKMEENVIYKQDRGEKGVRAFWVEHGLRCLRDFDKIEVEEMSKQAQKTLRR